MKIGIVGGTFDPIHAAHTYLVEECHHLLQLDKILVIPNGDPPHKGSQVTAAPHRLAMVRLALAGFDGVEVSDLELRGEQPSYTYLTLTKLKEACPQDELFFILGADSLVQFRLWKNPQVILDLATLVCFDRPSYRTEEVAQAARMIRGSGGQVILIDSLELEISSTNIRERISLGMPHRAFLHPGVYDYIRRHQLYVMGSQEGERQHGIDEGHQAIPEK